MTHLGFVREFLSDGVHPNLFVLTAMRLAIMNIECEKTNTVGVNGRIPPTKFTKIPPKFRAS